mmetsp:Transcript_72761/g.187734  ORF Transcript_72761/g.187734 Transcript_72761/m.187734 type:complete len:301 (-) Transcript_72761:3-905(-)
MRDELILRAGDVLALSLVHLLNSVVRLFYLAPLVHRDPDVASHHLDRRIPQNERHALLGQILLRIAEREHHRARGVAGQDLEDRPALGLRLGDVAHHLKLQVQPRGVGIDAADLGELGLGQRRRRGRRVKHRFDLLHDRRRGLRLEHLLGARRQLKRHPIILGARDDVEVGVHHFLPRISTVVHHDVDAGGTGRLLHGLGNLLQIAGEICGLGWRHVDERRRPLELRHQQRVPLDHGEGVEEGDGRFRLEHLEAWHLALKDLRKDVLRIVLGHCREPSRGGATEGAAVAGGSVGFSRTGT